MDLDEIWPGRWNITWNNTKDNFDLGKWHGLTTKKLT